MNKKRKKHDQLAKQFLTNISIAKKFLTQYLPDAVLKKCDLRTLTVESGTFIEEDLQSRYADIVYKVNLKTKEEHKFAYIYVLVEHQSIPEYLMPFRILRYQIGIIQKYLELDPSKTELKLPLVVPLVFYNGQESPYPYTTDIRELFADIELYDKIGLGRFGLIDLTIKEDNELLSHGKLAMLEVLLKHIYQRDIRDIKHLIVEVFKLAHEYSLSNSLVGGAVSYLILSRGEEIKEILELVSKEIPEYKENVMTYAEILIKQGRQEGLQKAQKEIAKELLKSGVSKELIANVTHLSSSQIEDLNRSLS